MQSDDLAGWTVLGHTDDGGTVYIRPRVGDAQITIGEALAHLDPPIPRRTLARLLAGLTPVGQARPAHGGPPARTYLFSDVVRAHADWVRRKSQDSSL